MKVDKFVKGTIILIIFNVIGKILGAFYRIPLANILGSEGMGQYQLTFPLYCLILTISSSGLPVAISKLVAEYNGKNNFSNSKKILKISLIILTIISVFCATILVVSAKFIAGIQGNKSIYICYYGIAPAVLFVGILSAFRGYFQGNMKMFPTAFSNFIEQVSKLGVGLYLSKKFLVYGVEYGVLGAVVGLSISEFFACLYLLITFLFFNKKQNVKSIGKLNSSKLLTKQLLSTSWPITLGGLITPLTSMIDSLLVVNLLMIIGYSSSSATTLLGLQAGAIEPLINIPVVISISISTALIPSISNYFAKNDMKNVEKYISMAMELCLSISIACFICFIIFGNQILNLLYANTFSQYELSIALKLLFLGSINIIFLSLVQISSSVLQGLNHQKWTVLSLSIGCVIKIIFEVGLILIKPINIFGTIISAGLCYLIIISINFKKIKQTLKINYSKVFSNLIFQETFVCVFAFFLNKLFIPFFGENITLFVAGTVTAMIFVLSYYIFFLSGREDSKAYSQINSVND